MTFITPATLSFNKQETLQKDKLKRNDSIVYFDKDSIIICNDYKHIKPKKMRFFRNKIHEYYFLNTNINLIVHVTLEYYNGNLVNVTLITKDKSRIDSLSNNIQTFFKKDFKNYELNPNDSRQWSYFQRDKLIIDRTIYQDNYEAEFTITNIKVKIPSFCGTKTPWRYFLKFWRW